MIAQWFVSGPATAITPPEIRRHPASATVRVGARTLFTVNVTGTALVAYPWRRNRVDSTGATAASYLTPVTTPADDGAAFTVKVVNARPPGAITISNVATRNLATRTVTAVTPLR